VKTNSINMGERRRISKAAPTQMRTLLHCGERQRAAGTAPTFRQRPDRCHAVGAERFRCRLGTEALETEGAGTREQEAKDTQKCVPEQTPHLAQPGLRDAAGSAHSWLRAAPI
jgi:hypothetical protein